MQQLLGLLPIDYGRCGTSNFHFPPDSTHLAHKLGFAVAMGHIVSLDSRHVDQYLDVGGLLK